MQKKAHRSFFIVLITCLLFSESNAQSFSEKYITNYRYYSVKDGLASREVFCAVQDSLGFMWFGTRNGLSRFDGSTFKSFSKLSHGLSDNKVIQLARDNHNRLVIIYGHPNLPRGAIKVEVFDLKNYKVLSLSEAFPGIPFSMEHVFWVANNGDGLDFLVNNPMQCWHLGVNGFTKRADIPMYDSFWADKHAITQGTLFTTMGQYCLFYKNKVAIGSVPNQLITERGVFALSTEQSWFQFSQEGDPLIQDHKGHYWQLGPDGKMKTLTPFKFKVEDWATARGNSYEVMQFEINSGIKMLTGEDVIELVSAKDLAFSSVIGLYSYYKDKMGKYWLCTSGGLYKVSVTHNRFTKYLTKSQLHDQENNQARGITTDDHGNLYANLWLRTYVTGNGSTHFVGEQSQIQYGLCQLGGKLYSGSYFLKILDAKTLALIRKIDLNGQSDIWNIEPYGDSLLLLCCRRFVWIFNTQNYRLQAVGYQNKDIPVVDMAYRIQMVTGGKCWVVAQNGMYLLDLNTRKMIDYYGRQAIDSSKKLPFDIIHDAWPDGQGNIWVLTNGQGLYRWNITSHSLLQFTTATGMPSDVLYRIEADNSNHIWVSTDNGLARINLANLHINTYTTADGITHDEFNRVSSYKRSDGRLYFGGLDGVTSFDPEDFEQDTALSNEPLRVVSFNQFSANEDRLIDKTMALQQSAKIVLNPGDRFFTLDFRLLDYEEGKRVYAYKVDGIDKDWNLLSDPSLHISGLAPGTYTLHVKGQNARRQWSADMLAIPIEVEAPFWEKNWFRLLAILILVAIAVLIFSWRTRQLRRSKEALERTVDKRTQQLRESLDQKDLMMKEIHHRVKNNLQVISSLLNLQLSRTADVAIQEALTESKNRVLSIAFIHQNLYQHKDLKSVEMKTFIQDLCNHIQDVFTKPEQPVAIAQDAAEIFLDIDTAVPLGLIINELLTNSFKYAFEDNKAGKIDIQLSAVSQGNYLFRYHDDGKGLPHDFDAAKSSSLGMRLVGRLAEQLGGSLEYHYENGSLFILHFRDFEERQKME